MARRTLLVPLLSISLLGCKFGSHRDAGKRGNPDDALARLDAADAAAARDPAQHARAGWLRYLIASDARGAALHFGAAASDGSPEHRALALCGLGELAEDLTDSAAAARDFADALAAAPDAPVAELAAIRLLDLEGESPAVDDLIIGAAAALPAKAAPRAARIVREAAARALGRKAQSSRDPQPEAVAWRKAGAIQHWRVAGPFAALRLFDLRTPSLLDGAEQKTVSTNARDLDVPDGDVGLELEPPEGDLFYAASDVTLEKGGEYFLFVEGAAALEARIDEEPLLSRSPWPEEVPRAQSVAVKLKAGLHRVLVRWTRAEGSRFRLSLARADGAPSDAGSAAPATLAGARKRSSCQLGTICVEPPRDRRSLRAYAEQQLEDDTGDPLAAYLFARATIGDDRIASRAAIDAAVSASASGAPALALRAFQELHDPDVPDRIGRGRALADLSEASRKDARMIRAALSAAALLRDSERYDDAAAMLDKADTALHDANAPQTARTLLARARLFDARGNVAAARDRSLQAEKAAPGRCDTLQALYELARREGSLKEQRESAEKLVGCDGGVQSLASMLRERGEAQGAESWLALAAQLRPAQPQKWQALAEAQTSRGEYPAAIASLQKAAQAAPRSPEPWRRLAGLYELAGDAKGAQESRATALRLAPGDLPLRQTLALDKHEKLLAWSDRDGLAIAKAKKPAEYANGASAILLLDQGAAEIYPDGGAVERVHYVARVLDKKGVQRFGEAQLPEGAQVLQLRTIKPDGRILEPESIPEKEGVTLPGLEPGDAVEIDYLRGLAPRGPELPGLALSGYYFRDDGVAMQESTYEVRAPFPLEADAHQLTLPPGALQDGRLSFTAREVSAASPEPHAPGEAEIMPWLQTGAGSGEKELVRSLADWALLRARPASATVDLARRSAGVSVRETLNRIYAAVAEAVRGRSQGNDFTTPAPHVLAQGRGNRLLLLKSALAAAQIPSHIVLARTVTSDPAAYRFPRPELLAYAVLRVEPGGDPVWIDPAYRLAPMNQLPAFVRGEEAWVLPEPGEEPQKITLPASLPGEDDGRRLQFELHLAESGEASGSGRDEHEGFEAASLKDALERLDKDQRKQAVESMLGRGLHGVTLLELQAEHELELGGPATLVYQLRVQLARKDSGRLYVPQSLMPARLARRWTQLAERTTPLLVDSPEQVTAHVSLFLPAGKHLKPGFSPAHLDTPFGKYDFSAREENGALILDETLVVRQQRVAPKDYAAFVRFASAVDEAQSSELIVE